ncbi:hypothetical protein G9A89_004502 [Geosiphon pyriformis]|nr:hypothetical protein G9A89_004502 [Geosiphon pyriformis]
MQSLNKTKKNFKDLPNLVLPFPPEATALKLIEKALLKLRTTGKTSRIPNAFIAYRMAVCKKLRSMNYPVITQPQLSSIAKEFWEKEPENVRREYQRIAAEARDIFKHLHRLQNPLQIEEENEQYNEQTFHFWHVKLDQDFEIGCKSLQNSPGPEFVYPQELISVPSQTWTSTDNSTVLESDHEVFNSSQMIQEPTIGIQSISDSMDKCSNGSYQQVQMEEIDFPSTSFMDSTFNPYQNSLASPYSTNQTIFNSDDTIFNYSNIPLSSYCTLSNYGQSIFENTDDECNKCKSKISELQNKVNTLEEKLAVLTDFVKTKFSESLPPNL